MVRDKKTVVQCDFDGTVTHGDVSFLILDAFARENWRALLDEYMSGAITVGNFNTRAFHMVTADERKLLDFVKGKVQVRAGFKSFLAYCRRRDFRLVVVSNGVAFYIRAILNNLGGEDIEVHAAEAQFDPAGMKVAYIGPDGKPLDDDFKGTFTRLFLKDGYRVIYVGNGISDLSPARQAHHIFATGDLLDACQHHNLKCVPFNTFKEVVKGLEQL